jgi:hypothetical protein
MEGFESSSDADQGNILDIVTTANPVIENAQAKRTFEMPGRAPGGIQKFRPGLDKKLG